MFEIFASLSVVLLGIVLTFVAIRRFSRRERQLLSAAFVFHVIAACAQVWITRGYYGSGDMLRYFVTGSALARVVRYDPGRFLPELWALLVHADSLWPVEVMGAGSSTGTMSAVSCILQLALGDSIYALCLALSVASFFGELALYRVFREVFPPSRRISLLASSMLLPSVVFWSSGILKETVAMAALGWLIVGLHRAAQGRRLTGLALVVVAGFWVAIVKAYILIALAAAGGVWWYWRRALATSGGRGVSIRPVYLVVGVAAVIVVMVCIGELFPRYALDNVGEETARLQQVGARVDGGSNYAIAAAPQRSLWGQLAYAPFALFTTVFRPLIFEVRNAPMAISALETGTLTVLLGRALVRHRWSSMWAQVTRSPALAFASVFVVTFGVGVGLATTNLGTLSRYRIPLEPFAAVLIFIWSGVRTSTSARRPGTSRMRTQRRSQRAGLPEIQR